MSKAKVLFRQISTGKYKGKRLQLPSLSTTRSTKTILKDSFFNSVQFQIEDTVFVEVFGGSGLMGLEALSRGAKEAYFIEIDKRAYRVLEENCALIDPSHTHPIHGDSFERFETILPALEQEQVIFYFDPPFDIREGMEGIYERVIELISQINPATVVRVAVEHMTAMDMPEQIGQLRRTKRKKFGRSALSYYEAN